MMLTSIGAATFVPLALSEPMKRAFYFVVLLALGLALIGFQFAKSRAVYGGGGSDPDELVNCSNCGSRIQAESEVCDHCGEPITDTGRAGKDG